MKGSAGLLRGGKCFDINTPIPRPPPPFWVTDYCQAFKTALGQFED